MSRWESGDVAANGIRLHYYRTGGAKPPVVLAHGFSDDALCWTPLAEALESDYDVVLIDARGHGQSDAPEQGYGSAEHAADLAGAIATLGVRRPAVLGHSMGAASTLVLAGMYPEIPRAILLEDPPAFWLPSTPPPAASEERAAQRRRWIADLQSKTREALMAEQRAHTPHWPEAELETWAGSKLRLSPNVLNSGANAPVDWPATLGRIACPALLIVADTARGAILKEEDAASLRALVPELEVAHIADAGHSIRRDQFDRYVEVIRAFLRATGDR